ncbi:MAG: inositol monophosphatase, partial [Methylococcales bacterium]|nr:inositol monophosphatase [Methylococcales bacterium]
KDYFWCIDPLDGTLPFIESTAGYAVSIALVSRIGIPHIGVIYDPVKETLYNATKEGGVFRNGQPWQLSPCVDNSNKILTVVTDRSFKQHSFFSKILAEIESSALTMRFSGISTIMYGGAAMNACWVLENHPACYFKFPKPQLSGGSLWDFAASACLFKEMGVVVSDMQSKSLDLNRADSTFMNHRGVLYASNDEIADQIKLIYSKATRNK